MSDKKQPAQQRVSVRIVKADDPEQRGEMKPIAKADGSLQISPEAAYPAGEVTKEEILRRWNAWDAHAAHGDTYSLRRQYADRLEKLLDCKIPIHRKINSNKLARDRRRARQCRYIYKKQHKALAASASQNTRPAGVMPWA